MGLMAGRPCALHFKQRNLTVLLTPGPVYGFDEHALIVAGVGTQCGVIDLRKVTVTPLIRAGLSASAAQILKLEIERAYQHANQTIEG